jgi:hypothetical protein
MIDPEKADAEMGRRPDFVRRDGTRVYTRPMDDGRTRITTYHPNGSVETAKAMVMTEADKKMAAEIFGGFTPKPSAKKSRLGMTFLFAVISFFIWLVIYFGFIE